MTDGKQAKCGACGRVPESPTAIMDNEAAARTRSADHRATAMAATASIAAGLALSGATVIVDTGKLNDPPWVRQWFQNLLLGALVLLVLAAASSTLGHF